MIRNKKAFFAFLSFVEFYIFFGFAFCIFFGFCSLYFFDFYVEGHFALFLRFHGDRPFGLVVRKSILVECNVCA
jgi:hypothetical protein